MNSKISFIHAPTNFKTPGSVQVIIVINDMKLIFVLWLKQDVDETYYINTKLRTWPL